MRPIPIGRMDLGILAALAPMGREMLMEMAKETVKATMRRSGVGKLLDRLGHEKRVRAYAEQLADQAREWPADKAMRVIVHPAIGGVAPDFVEVDQQCQGKIRIICLARGPFPVSLESYSLEWKVRLRPNAHELAWGRLEMKVPTEWQEKGADRTIDLPFTGPLRRPVEELDKPERYALVSVQGAIIVAGAWQTYQSKTTISGAAYIPIFIR